MAKKQYTLDELKEAMKVKQAFEAYVEDVDGEYNLHCIFANDVKGIVPREEVSTVVEDDGKVDSNLCIKKKGKIMQVCIKEITEEDGEIRRVILSRRELELYVSNTFEGFKSLIYIKLMSSMSVVIDHMLDPSRLMSGDFSSADYFLIVEKLMSYIETLERLKSSIVVAGADVELGQMASQDTGGADKMSDEAKEFLKLMKKSKGIE